MWTACSATTTSGRWASPSGRRWPPSRSSARWPTRLGPRRGRGGGPFLGTLVARVGLVPNAVLAGQFVALAHLAPGRVIAGLGTGDRLSAAENRAYGIAFPSAAERRAELVELAGALVQAGLTVWVGGGPAGRRDEAEAVGAALTLWDAEPCWWPSGPRAPMPSR